MGTWVNQSFNLSAKPSECGNLSYVSAKPGEDKIIVGLAQYGLLAKAHADEEWVQLGQGEGSASIINRCNAIVYDPADSQVFWEAGIYNAGGVYRTDDGGETFVDLGLTHNDVISVDLTDPERQLLLVSGHEMSHRLNRSLDGGMTWEDIGDKLPDEPGVCPNPLILDSDNYLIGCVSAGGGKKGIWRTEDAGKSWEQVSDVAGATVPLVATDGSIYWVGENNEGIVRSDDEGRTWTKPFGAGVLSQVNALELPDGRIAAVAQKQIAVSSDQGEHWKLVTVETPFIPTGLTYSAEGKAFYVAHWTCDNKVPKDAVMSYDFDYESE